MSKGRRFRSTSPPEAGSHPDASHPEVDELSGTAIGSRLTTAQMRLLIVGLLLGLFLSSTEQSVVAIALPTLAGELGAANQVSWAVTAYLLTSMVATPLYGKMSDLFGRRIVYQTAISMFLVGTILCAISQTMTQLVAARSFQGLGGGGLTSLAFVILGDVVSPRQRGRYIGLFTVVFTVSAVIGPLWGGVLIDGPGWRWMFGSVVPLALAALIITNRALRLPFPTRQPTIDWLGIALLVIASVGLILVPIWAGDTFSWSDWQLITAAIAGPTAAIGFILWERHATEPVIPLRLFRNPTISSIYAMGALFVGSLVAMLTFVPFFLQISTGASATRSGLLMIPDSLGFSLLAAVSGWLVARSGRYRWALRVGPLLCAGALFAMTRVTPDTGGLELAPILFLLGMGQGLVYPNLTLTVQNAATPEDLGIATTVSNFCRALGGAFGAALGGAALTRRLDDELRDRLSAADLEALGGTAGLLRSPAAVDSFEPELQALVAGAVGSSVAYLAWWTVPVMLCVAIIALGVTETPLRTTSTVGGDDQADDALRSPHDDDRPARAEPDSVLLEPDKADRLDRPDQTGRRRQP